MRPLTNTQKKRVHEKATADTGAAATWLLGAAMGIKDSPHNNDDERGERGGLFAPRTDRWTLGLDELF